MKANCGIFGCFFIADTVSTRGKPDSKVEGVKDRALFRVIASINIILHFLALYAPKRRRDGGEKYGKGIGTDPMEEKAVRLRRGGGGFP